jgi:tetratricopeptide (TPR) repeat protein
MTLAKSPSLYNQDRLSDDEFVAHFVARRETLEAMVRRLEAARHDRADGQQILIGARGMGKTSLLRRLAIEINQRPDLSACFLPLRFREEQYNVLRLEDFWRNCGEALAEWAEANAHQDLANRLDAALAGASWAGDEASAGQFEAELTRLNRRAVLLVDNLDLILDALTSEDRWTLRRHLQAKVGPLVIGAATRMLRDSADREAAFYEFFQPHHLEPLDQAETESCMRALADRRGAQGKPVLDVLTRQPQRLKTLHVLTGGNPRVLALIYRLLESAETDQAMADLDVLLDQVTPYYKARIEEYPTAQQRAVIDAIALHWDPVATGDLSRITGIVSTTLSPLLIKLRKDGLIESVETSGSYAGHQLVERFLNIWYLMRHGTRRTKQKMRWLVAFLANFYTRSDLTGLADRMRSSGGAARWHPAYASAFEEALLCAPAWDSAEAPSARAQQRSHAKVAKRIRSATAGAERSKDEHLATRRVAEMVKSANDLIEQASAFWEGGDSAAAIAAFNEVVSRFAEAPEPALRERVAKALVNKGVALRQAGDTAGEIAAYDEVVVRFADAPEPALIEWVAWALVYKGVASGQSGDHAAEIAAYDEVVARFAEAPEAAIREQVAWALVFKGGALRQSGDHVAAIAAYDEVVARFAEAPEAAIREQVAWALVSKGIALGQSGDHAAAIAAYDAVIVRFADQDDSSEFKTIITEAEVRLGNLLLDTNGDLPRAEDLFLRASAVMPLVAQSNLVWLYLQADRVGAASELRLQLSELPEPGLSLIDAGLQLAQRNFGLATEHLGIALQHDLDDGGWSFGDDLERLLCLGERKGFGEQLIAWFEETGLADRLAPVHLALKAYVRGEKALLDANPETRGPARIIFERLVARRPGKQDVQAPSLREKRGRRRSRKTS